MGQALDKLKSRGFFKQCSDEEQLDKMLSSGQISLYCGFDPTAESLHVGHLVPIMAMAHLQQAGHKPIAVVGGGTSRIGDPTDKSETRKMLTPEQITINTEAFKKQIARFIDFSDDKAIMVDNADWLMGLGYIEFLRDIGRHFSVNRMLTFETFKARLEREQGLSFIEFNYQLLQSYDFLELFRKYGCTLQIGGDDQWANMISGMDLIRRVERGETAVLTFPLVTRSDGKKMGKTEKGALFLDSRMTSVYDFFQYWRNVPDGDVEKFLLLYTFLPIEECKRLGSLQDQEINQAKEILAFELTKLIHGEEEAKKALDGAKAAFAGGANKDGMPTGELAASELESGINIMDFFSQFGLCTSKSEARRLVQQNGAAVNGDKINDVDAVINSSHIVDGEILLKAGKKRFFRVVIK
ncbi:MAG: tyrosine--tRNA ligase [Spirochaetaceae bacterium]|jgi:tyrosyl-tRNA synthetase|nr:tyrosine--tRNA ligase [Spirochaetaceae bacterium]